MQRKPGFPVANCNIKMPDSIPPAETGPSEEEGEQQQRRLQLINFGHSQWGFNNWSWSVTKQELDFVDFANGKYIVGVVAYVSVNVKSFDIHRENIGYATCCAPGKGSAIYQARKCAVTNGLRETLLSFGGSVYTELTEMQDAHKSDCNNQQHHEPVPDNQGLPKPTEPKNSPLNKNVRKDSSDSGASCTAANSMRSPHPMPPAIKNAVVANPPPPVAKAHPMPANLPPTANRAPIAANAPRPPPPAPVPVPVPPHVRPNSNEARPPDGAGAQSEEEARAERKRRQKQAQEEFRLKQLSRQQADLDEQQEAGRHTSTTDELLLDVRTQDIVIQETCSEGKRRSPAPNTSAKRRPGLSRLNIVQGD